VAIPASSATAARACGRLLLLREVMRLFRYGRSGRFKRRRLVEIFSRPEHKALHYFGLLGSYSTRKRALRCQSKIWAFTMPNTHPLRPRNGGNTRSFRQSLHKVQA
jgi:hypothetical protein